MALRISCMQFSLLSRFLSPRI